MSAPTTADDPDTPGPAAPGRPARPGRQRTFAALEVPAFRILFASGTIAFLAVQAQIIARGWLANELSGSNAGLGAVYMAFGVPMLLATPFGGVIADRLPKRTVVICAQLGLASTALFIGLGVALDFVAYWMLLVTAGVQACSFAFLGPARVAMVSEIVGKDLLSNAIVLSQMSLNSSRILGPAFAGVGIGIAWFGTAGVYFTSGALSLLAAAAMIPLPPARAVRTGPPRSPLAEFRDGLSYVRARRNVFILLLTSFVVVMMGFPYLAFLPRVADVLFDVGAGGYGALSAASAVGALGVTFFIAGRAGGEAAWRIQLVSGLGFGVALVVLAVAPSYPLALLAILLIGATAAGFQSMNNSLVLALTELEYHGRIQSLMMLSFSGFGMAALPLGALADAIGLRQTLAVMGVVVFVAAGTSAIARAHSPVRRRDFG